MSEIRTKLLHPHLPDCWAIKNTEEGTWPTPWAYLERVERRISNGNKAGARQSGDRWWYVRCNNPNCPADVVINETDLLAGVSS